MAREFDLLGDPIPDNHGKRGANGHTPTKETCRKIRVLLVSGLSKKRIAEELGITMPTLNKHYFHSGRVKVRHAREMALADQRARTMLQLDAAAAAGNVTAQKAILGIIDAEELSNRADDVAGRNEPSKSKAAPLPKGKKEALSDAAADILANDPLLNPEMRH